MIYEGSTLKDKKRILAASSSRILFLVAILAALTPLSLPRAKVTSAQTETTLSAPELTAIAAGSSAIDLSWTAVPGAVRYELYTQLVDDPGWQQLDGGNLEGTTYRHGDLTPGKRYQYAVRAIDANDQPLGPWSNFPTETVPSSEAATLTSTPTPRATQSSTTLTAPVLTATAAGSNAIDLSWTSVPGAVRYALFTQLVDDPGWQQLDGGNLRGTSFRHSGLTPGKTYQYAVRAIDANDQPLGPWSNFPKETVPASDAPTSTPTATSTPTSTPTPGATPTATSTASALSAPSLTATAAGSNAIDLNWTPVRGAVRYVLFTQLVADPGWQQLDGGNLRGTSYRHDELEPGVTYQYAVRAIDANNQELGPWSNFPTENVPASTTGTSTATATATPVAPDAVAERAALVALYQATSGANWTYSDNWLSNQPLSTWRGVTTDASDHVTQLYLPFNGLHGQIPDLSALTNLKELYLYHNDLTGPIPDLSALVSLTFLDIGSSKLTGPIPDLSTLTNLTGLILSTNDLTGPVPDLSALTDLTHLDLAFNQLTGSIPDLRSLTKLSHLTLNSNQLTGPLPDLSALTHLARLDLAGNQLCLPAGANLSHSNSAVAAHLQSLALPSCTAATAPTLTPTSTPTPGLTPTASAQSAPALTATLSGAHAIDLSWTAVPGAVRYALWTRVIDVSDWQKLDGGSLKDTSYTHNGLAPGATYQYAVRAIDANSQPLGPWSNFPTETVPASTTATPTATATPVAPDAAAERAALVALYQATSGANWTNSDNWLSNQPLSSWRGVTTDGSGHVTGLRLFDNGLNGPLPDLSGLTKLTSLSLNGNKLCQPDGATLFHSNAAVLAHLQSLALPSCSNVLNATPTATPTLTPTPGVTPTPTMTPTAIAVPPVPAAEREALVALYNATDGANWTYNDNWLSQEPVATWHGVFTDENGHVARLVLARNGLRGSIPDLGALTDLTNLDLGLNRLSGSIPDLSALTELTNLDLGDNELSGLIPDLSDLTSLQTLALSHNDLTGLIPALSALTSLTYVNLASNDLSGPIPELNSLTNLSVLYLSRNGLTGQIPDMDALTRLWRLSLASNELTGEIADLSALTNLSWLYLHDNELTGQIPDLSALTNLTVLDLSDNELTGTITTVGAVTSLWRLSLSSNKLSGEIPDLSALTNLRWLYLNGNELTGQISDLSALTALTKLDLSDNQLSEPVPDLSTLTNLSELSLSNNQLSGPILDFGGLTNLRMLILNNNQLSGPVPDLRSLTKLETLSLADNQFCLPADYDFSASSDAITNHLNSLSLATCTGAELAAVPGVPQNLSTAISGSQVTISWDAASNGVSYDLWTWDSINRQWGPIGGALTTTTYTHSVQTDGRNYYYQVRARDANDVRGAWSERVAAVLSTQFPPPPPSLGLDLFFQKYLEVGGIIVVAPSEVSDEQMVRSRGVITGMLENRSDLIQVLADNGTRISIHGSGGNAANLATGWVARVSLEDPHCRVLIHELAHLIHFAIEEQAEGQQFETRLTVTYQAALKSRLWERRYAATNSVEYWAETVRFWFQDFLPSPLNASYSKLADYDPEAAKLIEEVFGSDATVPATCKP